MKAFSATTRQEALGLLEQYPNPQAALLPILHLAQREFGCIDVEAEQAVAELMEIPVVSVREVSHFYFMYHQHAVGKFHFVVCHNISCTIMGAETILEAIKARLGIEDGQVTPDGLFSVERAECLACCDRAPALLVNEELHTNLTPEKLDKLIAKLKNNSPLQAERLL